MRERIANILFIVLAAFFGCFLAGNANAEHAMNLNAMIIGGTVSTCIVLAILYAPNNWLTGVSFIAFLVITGYFVFTAPPLGKVLMDGFFGSAFANLIYQQVKPKKRDAEKPTESSDKADKPE